MDKITVYGAGWCGDTQRTLRQLDNLGVAYDYIDVEQDEGKEMKPTVKLGEQVLSVPSNRELESALREKGMLKSKAEG
jgi:mycoredoxin